MCSVLSQILSGQRASMTNQNDVGDICICVRVCVTEFTVYVCLQTCLKQTERCLLMLVHKLVFNYTTV